jgi:hypothetical protein
LVMAAMTPVALEAAKVAGAPAEKVRAAQQLTAQPGRTDWRGLAAPSSGPNCQR